MCFTATRKEVMLYADKTTEFTARNGQRVTMSQNTYDKGERFESTEYIFCFDDHCSQYERAFSQREIDRVIARYGLTLTNAAPTTPPPTEPAYFAEHERDTETSFPLGFQDERTLSDAPKQRKTRSDKGKPRAPKFSPVETNEGVRFFATSR